MEMAMLRRNIGISKLKRTLNETVIRYMETYLRNFHDTMLTERLSPLLKIFNALEPDELTVDKSIEIINRVGAVFVDCWAKYHLGWILLGILAILKTILSSLVLIRSQGSFGGGRAVLLKSVSFCLYLWATLARNESIPPVVGITLGIEITMHVHRLLTNLLATDKLFEMIDVLALIILMLHAVAVFSNSYIVNDDLVVQYLLKTLFVLLFVDAVRHFRWVSSVNPTRRKAHGRSKYSFSHLFSVFNTLPCILVMSLISSLCLLRLSALFRRCREEIPKCSMSFFLLPFGSIFDGQQRLIRATVAFVSLLTLYLVPWRHLRELGCIQDGSVKLLALKTAIQCVSVSVFFSWCYCWLVELYPKLLDSVVILFFPRVCYGMFMLFLITFLIDPLLVHSIALRGKRDTPFSSKYECTALTKAKQMQKAAGSGSSTVCVFGIRSMVVRSLLVFIWMLYFVLALLLGDGLCASVASLLLISVLFLKIRQTGASEFSGVVFSVELASHFFYAFGHQPTFTAIPWDAAFTGVPGNFKYMWIQAALVILNVSASCILVSISLPLIINWRKEGRGGETETVISPASQESSIDRDLFRCNMLFLTAIGVKV
ncbi:hypothetical protein D918_02373 [Trichuris suis]|nr:hypothetical protein D918_02373 [Trichuris suis]